MKDIFIQHVRVWSIPAKVAYGIGKELIAKAEASTAAYLDEHRGMTVEQAQETAQILMSDDYRVAERGKRETVVVSPNGIPMRLPCPACGKLHVDEGAFATKPHHTHACQFCGMVWRPAVVATVGVQFLPGYKNEANI